MDWTKAKNILIIALLITDCILGGLFYLKYVKSDVAPASEVEATLEVLKDHSIYVDTEIPEKSRRMPVLFVKYEEEDEEEINRILKSQDSPDEFSMEEEALTELCDGVLEQCGLLEETAVFDSIRFLEDGQAEVKYKNIYRDIPVEESGIICTVEDGRVISIQRTWLTPTGYGKTKQKVIQSTDALIQFMSDWVKREKEEDLGEDIPKDVHIEDIELVYWLDTSVGPRDGVMEDTAVPAWKLTYNGGQVTFIDAYDQQ